MIWVGGPLPLKNTIGYVCTYKWKRREGADGSICNYDKDDVGGVDNDDHDHGHRGDRRVQEEVQEWERMDLVEKMHN